MLNSSPSLDYKNFLKAQELPSLYIFFAFLATNTILVKSKRHVNQKRLEVQGFQERTFGNFDISLLI